MPRSHSIIIEELLNQLLKEETDFGGNGLQGHYSPLQDGRATGTAGKLVKWKIRGREAKLLYVLVYIYIGHYDLDMIMKSLD